jgi:hypothetical protein
MERALTDKSCMICGIPLDAEYFDVSGFVGEARIEIDEIDKLTFRTPADSDPRIFPMAFFVRTAHPDNGMLSLDERRYTKRLRPWGE